MSRYHAVVWIDHQEAHVLHFTSDEAEKTMVHAHAKHRQTHHRKGVIGGGKAPEDPEYFGRVAALERATRQLRSVDATLDRLHEPDFGLCQDCYAEIPYARLSANPVATRCTACQELAEKT